MQQKPAHFFLHQEAGAVGNNIGKFYIKLYIINMHDYIFTENICSARNPKQVAVFCKHVLIL